MSALAPSAAYETRLDGSLAGAQDLLTEMRRRVRLARDDRRRYEGTWMESQAFAAGKQWVEYVERIHRIAVPKLQPGRSRQTADVLNQNVQTAIGELTGDDLRPQFLFAAPGASSQDTADYVNRAFTYCWEYEVDADTRLYALVNKLAVHGTAAVRCRYDRSRGPLMAQVPHRAGRPITDGAEAAGYVADRHAAGLSAEIRDIREGHVVWELLSVWNLLPPPGIEDEADFPWEMIVRPVYIPSLVAEYGAVAWDLRPESIEAMDVLGRDTGPGVFPDARPQGKLEDHVLVYTCYERPCPDYPRGRTVVFTESQVLSSADELPYPEAPGRAASTGITYFKWWPVAGRFWGKGFIEPGVGPQRTRNKRITQIDEIIDRGLPYVIAFRSSKIRPRKGLPMEVLEVANEAVRPPQPVAGMSPGQWMIEDVQMHDINIEKGLGVHPGGVGENPSGVNAYAQLALVVEQNMKKFGPVNGRLKLGVGKLSSDTLEAMRHWPASKQILVAGPDDQAEALEFQASKIPLSYVLRKPGKGATLPHSVAAEMQKIGDVWQARLAMGPPTMEWLQWYVGSLNAGKMLELPLDAGEQQRHKAALENVAMLHGAPAPPVAPFDEFAVHDPIHAAEEERISALQSPELQAALQQLQLHRQAHAAQQQQDLARMAAAQQPQVQASPLGAPGGPVPQFVRGPQPAPQPGGPQPGQ